MTIPGEAFWAWNTKKAKELQGEEFICRECGEPGVVGDNLWAATGHYANGTVIEDYWIHGSCVA